MNNGADNMYRCPTCNEPVTEQSRAYMVAIALMVMAGPCVERVLTVRAPKVEPWRRVGKKGRKQAPRYF